MCRTLTCGSFRALDRIECRRLINLPHADQSVLSERGFEALDDPPRERLRLQRQFGVVESHTALPIVRRSLTPHSVIDSRKRIAISGAGSSFVWVEWIATGIAVVGALVAGWQA